MPRAELQRWHFSLIAVSVAWGIAGCGGGTDPLNRQAVSGQVLLNDELLDTGSISFDPQDRVNGRSGGAVIEEGEFKINRERGLPPGVYTVRIYSADTKSVSQAVEEMPGETRRVAPERIPATWNSESEQTITVEEGAENRFELSIR